MWTKYSRPFVSQYDLIRKICLIAVAVDLSLLIFSLPFVVSDASAWEGYKIFLICFSIILLYIIWIFGLYWKYSVFNSKQQIVPKWFRVVSFLSFSFYLVFYELEENDYRFYIFLKKSLVDYFLLLIYLFCLFLGVISSNDGWANYFWLGVSIYAVLFLVWLFHFVSLVLFYKYRKDSKFLKILSVLTFNQKFLKKINFVREEEYLIKVEDTDESEQDLILSKYSRSFSDQYRIVGLISIWICLSTIGLFVSSIVYLVTEEYRVGMLVIAIFAGFFFFTSCWTFFLYWKAAQYVKINQPIAKWLRVAAACSFSFYLAFRDFKVKNHRVYLLLQEIHFYALFGIFFVLYLFALFFLINGSWLWLGILLAVVMFLLVARFVLALFICRYRGSESRLLKILIIVTLSFRNYRLYQQIIELNKKI